MTQIIVSEAYITKIATIKYLIRDGKIEQAKKAVEELDKIEPLGYVIIPEKKTKKEEVPKL